MDDVTLVPVNSRLTGTNVLLIFLWLRILFFDFRSLIAEFAEALDNGLRGCFFGIVSDGNHLLGNVALNLLDSFLETKIALDLVLTTGTVHLWQCGYY